jgi:hypothetical protein
VFSEDLRDLLPDRVLPIATRAPLDPIALFTEEIEEVARLLRPGKRKGTEAVGRLRALSIVDGAIQRERLQPSEYQLRKLGSKISAGAKGIDDLFPGIAAVGFVAEGSGPNINLRITKREGIPVKLVQEGSPDTSVVGVKRVSELDYYSMRYKDLATKLKITTNQTGALIELLGIKSNEDYAKKIINTWCYSAKTLDLMYKALEEAPVTEWWERYKGSKKPEPRGDLPISA